MTSASKELASSIERIQQARADVLAEIEQIEARIAKTRARIQELTRTGIVPAPEARAAFHAECDRLSETARDRLNQYIGAFAHPRCKNPLRKGWIKPAPTLYQIFKSNRPGQLAPAVVLLLEGALRDYGDDLLAKLCNRPTALSVADRETHVEALAAELAKLEQERDDLQDEVGELFKTDRFELSERTRERRRRDREEAAVAGLNKPNPHFDRDSEWLRRKRGGD